MQQNFIQNTNAAHHHFSVHILYWRCAHAQFKCAHAILKCALAQLESAHDQLKCAYAQLRCPHALLKVCVCNTGGVHMFDWKYTHAQTEVYMCSTEECTCSITRQALYAHTTEKHMLRFSV